MAKKNSSMKALSITLLFLVMASVVLASYNSDGSVNSASTNHEFRMIYADDNGNIIGNATCYWTVLYPNSTVFVNNASWTGNSASGNISAYYNYTVSNFSATGFYNAVTTCDYASDSPSSVSKDSSFLVKSSLVSSADIQSLEDLIRVRVSYNGDANTFIIKNETTRNLFNDRKKDFLFIGMFILLILSLLGFIAYIIKSSGKNKRIGL